MTELAKPGELQNKFREIVEGCLESTNATVHLEAVEGYNLTYFQFSVVVPNPTPPPEEPKKKRWFSTGRRYSPFIRTIVIHRYDLGPLFPDGSWHTLSIRIYDVKWIPVGEKIARAYSKITGAECTLALPFSGHDLSWNPFKE